MVVTNGWPQHPAVTVDQFSDEWAAVVGFGEKITAELSFRVGLENRSEKAAVVTDQQRLVIGDELGEQRHQEECQKNPQRPPAPAIGLEVLDAPLGNGAEAAVRVVHTSRSSKSIRGSMTVYIRSPARFMTSPSTEKKNNVPNITG